MYSCKFCGDEFKNKGGRGSHEKYCNKNPNSDEHSLGWSFEKVKCPECEVQVAKKDLKRHKNSKACKAGGTWETIKEESLWSEVNDQKIKIREEWKIGEDKFECPECEKTYPEKGIATHIWRKHTDEGENFENNIQINNVQTNLLDENGNPWNKGLTKEDHPSIKSQSNKLSKKYSENPEEHPFYGESHSEEFKKWKSQQMTEFYKKNPEKHPNRVLAGNRNEMSYPEKLVDGKLNELNYKFTHNKKILKYYPDFLLTEYDVIIEVDGERWHSSRDQKEYDRKRDKELESEGYDVYRIPAKNVLQHLDNLISEIRLESS